MDSMINQEAMLLCQHLLRHGSPTADKEDPHNAAHHMISEIIEMFAQSQLSVFFRLKVEADMSSIL